MVLKDDNYYSIKETSHFIEMSERLLQMYAKKNNFRKIDNRYIFSGHQIKELLSKRNEKRTKKKLSSNVVSDELKNLRLEIKEKENLILELQQENNRLKEQLSEEIPHQEKLKKAIQLITLEAMEQGVQHKVFSEQEYQDLIGTISEVDFQKEQVQYLRNRVERQDDILNKLVEQSANTIAERRERNYIEAKDKNLDK